MKNKILIFISIIIISCIFSAYKVYAEGNKATILDLKGTVMVNVGGQEYVEAYRGMEIKQGYSILSGDDSWVVVEIQDQNTVKLDQNSNICFSNLSLGNDAIDVSITVTSGGVFTNLQNKLSQDSIFRIVSENTVIETSGASFGLSVSFDGESTTVQTTVIGGEVISAGTKSITAGESETTTTTATGFESLKNDSTSFEDMGSFLVSSIIESGINISGTTTDELTEIYQRALESEHQKKQQEATAEETDVKTAEIPLYNSTALLSSSQSNSVLFDKLTDDEKNMNSAGFSQYTTTEKSTTSVNTSPITTTVPVTTPVTTETPSTSLTTSTTTEATTTTEKAIVSSTKKDDDDNHNNNDTTTATEGVIELTISIMTYGDGQEHLVDTFTIEKGQSLSDNDDLSGYLESLMLEGAEIYCDDVEISLDYVPTSDITIYFYYPEPVYYEVTVIGSGAEMGEIFNVEEGQALNSNSDLSGYLESLMGDGAILYYSNQQEVDLSDTVDDNITIYYFFESSGTY